MTLGRRALLGSVAAAVGAATLAGSGCDVGPRAAPRPGPDGATAWANLLAGPVPAADEVGRPFLHRVVPTVVPAAVVGGPAAPGLHGNLPDAESASYLLQRLDAQVAELGATFAFGPGSEDGALCLARFEQCPASTPAPAAAPRSTCHLALTARRWVYGVILGPALEIVASRELTRPLPQDGTAATLRVRAGATTAVVDAPDGTTHRIDDPRIGALSTDAFACWEFFKLGPGGADVTFLRTWAR